MKTKIIFAISCLILAALLFSGCRANDTGNGDDQSCTHRFVEGVCENCGESDPNYTPGEGAGDEDDQKPEEEEDNSKIPPIDTDTETELPFVPAG